MEPEATKQTTKPPSFSPEHFLATGFYSGLSPFMPGTAGSILVFAIYCALSLLAPALFVWYWQVLLAVVIAGVGVWSSNRLLSSARYAPEEKDPQQIVIDEFAGFAVSVIGLGPEIPKLVLALVCFRIFDILKPPPVCNLEKLPRGWGIMADDLAAGVYAAILIRAILLYGF